MSSNTELKKFVKADKKISNWKNIQHYCYTKNNASRDIMYFIAQPNGKGAACERLARELFSSLKVRSGTGHDHICEGKKGEQKTSAYWNCKDFKWQHIELGHDWKFLILTAIHFTEIKWYFLSRKTLRNMMRRKNPQVKIQGDGKGSNEGRWFYYSKVISDLTEFKTNDELLKLVSEL